MSDGVVVAPGRPKLGGLSVGVLANLVGRAWPTLLGILVVPLYLRWLGNEAYGLVGAFSILQVVCSVLDMGLGTTLTRQLARAAAGTSSAEESRNLVRSLEIPYWSAAALIAAVSLAAAAPLSSWWLTAQTLPPETIRRAAVLMGCTAAAQLPFTLYTGGLLGLNRQVLLNSVTVTIATLRVGATVLVLKFASPTIEAFFACQLVAGAAQTAAGAVALWASLPKSAARARFDGGLLRANFRFAAGVASITVVSIALTQADKVALSRILPLGVFAFYVIASQVSGALLIIAAPVFTAVFPRLSSIVARGDAAAEAREYHRAGQTLAVLLLPAAVVLAWFSRDVLYAWTGKVDVADNAYVATSLLVVGTAMNGLMHVPYALTLAHGWTKLPLVMNAIAIVFLVPLVVWASLRYGVAGAASAWILLNGSYVTINVQIMHSRLLPAEKTRWYVHDVALPLLGAVAGAALANLLLPETAVRPLMLARVAAVGATSLVGAAAGATEIRGIVLATLRRR